MIGRAGVSRPPRIEYTGAFYHVTSRGNERKETFGVQFDDKKGWHKNGGSEDDIEI
jgi:hypothetical protein